MSIVELLLVLILSPIGICAIILCIGHQATTKARMDHTENMFELSEKAKLNAINVRALDMGIREKEAEQLERFSHPVTPCRVHKQFNCTRCN